MTRQDDTATLSPIGARARACPWLRDDGKPGDILGLMAQAAREAESLTLIEKRDGKDSMTYTSAADIKRSARILAKLGIVTQWRTSEEVFEGKLGRLRVTAQFIAADGSYLEYSAVNASYAGMGRHFTVATTAAVKVIYSLALQLVTDDASEGTKQDTREHDDEEKWSDAVLAAVAAIDACATTEQMAEIHQHPAHQKLTQAERRIVIAEWHRRQATLEKLRHGNYAADLRRGR